MNSKRKWIVGACAAALVAGGTGAALATGSDDSEPPIRGKALTKASAAALDHTGGGRVTDSEAGDEDAFYEVEVTLNDGSRVDVHLDKDFKVVNSEADQGGEDE
ncbi:PepSY domain-containing protein [Streptomyces sp. KR80]|uniref:PepSY domain-containing protein n=1 Tax=Streptomyces sp. KR80 TaxID=3457426 RepID=UPI003FD639A9